MLVEPISTSATAPTITTKTESERLAGYRAKIAAMPESQRLPRVCKPDGKLIALIAAEFRRACQ